MANCSFQAVQAGAAWCGPRTFSSQWQTSSTSQYTLALLANYYIILQSSLTSPNLHLINAALLNFIISIILSLFFLFTNAQLYSSLSSTISLGLLSFSSRTPSFIQAALSQISRISEFISFITAFTPNLLYPIPLSHSLHPCTHIPSHGSQASLVASLIPISHHLSPAISVCTHLLPPTSKAASLLKTIEVLGWSVSTPKHTDTQGSRSICQLSQSQSVCTLHLQCTYQWASKIS